MLNAVSVGRACATRTAAALAGVLCGCGAAAAVASEGGASFYIPGLTIPMAGFLPTPGVFFDNTTYFYQGKLTSGRNTALGGNIVAGVKVDAKVDFATALWVTPLEILGGNLGFSLSLPFGEPAVRAGAVLSGPVLQRLVGRPVGSSASDSTFNYGDPVLSTMIGWHAGNWHWKVAAAVNIPAGAYQPGEFSNLALNRWLGDFSGAITYPELGIDLSTAAGYGERREPRYPLRYRQGAALRGWGHEAPDEGAVGRPDRRGARRHLRARECATKFGIASITRLAGGFSRVKGNRSW